MARRLMLLLLAVVIILLGLSLWLIGFYTDWLWFEQVGYRSVFTARLAWTCIVWLGSGLLFSGFIFFNLRATTWALKQRTRMDTSPFWDGPRLRRGLYLVSLILGFVISAGFSTRWEVVARFIHRTPFGYTDPVFHQDIGFYVFQLPLFEQLYVPLQGLLLVTLVAVGLSYVLGRVVGFEERKPHIVTKAKVHLSILIALVLTLKALDYLLGMYQLVYSPRGAVFGPSYTDVHTQILAAKAMAITTGAVAVSVLWNAFQPRLRWVISGIILLVVESMLLGSVYPNLVQRYVVEPNELAKEERFIGYNIDATRQAFGLDNIVEHKFVTQDELPPKQCLQSETVDNIRLWDWRPLLETYSQLQEFRLYYDFTRVDTDRYWVDGEYRQVMVAPRELAIEQLHNRTWVNERLQYTHGYGLVMSPVNRVTPEGLPDLWIYDIPPKSKMGEALAVTRPEIYYGEQTNHYVFVRTEVPEFDYPRGDQNAETLYQGTGGVPMGSWGRRLLFALRFQDSRILWTQSFTKDSRVMYYRNIQERVRKIAPFLRYDNEPYMVVADGRLFWILDAYTSSDRYPYVQPVAGWGNYVRNSVKVVVDAYNGTVTYYMMNERDPLALTLGHMYPGLFRPLTEMPASLRAHIRYPEELFLLQARIYGTYHMANPRVFYNQEDLWNFPREIYGDEQIDMQAYYTIMELPGEIGRDRAAEFVLMLPFTPAEKANMVAWLAARNDGEHYGQLVLHKFPKQKLTYGPMQIEARIDQDAEISRQLALWDQKGSRVVRGNLLVLPLGDSILYVEPLYLKAKQGELPELRRVIASLGGKIVMAETVEEALNELFEERVLSTPEESGESGVGIVLEPESVPPDSPLSRTEGKAQAALELFGEAKTARQSGDWGRYGEILDELEILLRELAEQEQSQ
ncbi:MAG: UPF0182 family protein [Firmicutes bacterium]|jgi:uncharacterized membrane protein (UPF0182 family)|nr:UPF0182 family protein [Bacillota bacterium]